MEAEKVSDRISFDALDQSGACISGDPDTVIEKLNAYGRYWLGAGHRNGDFHVELAFGRYQNLRVVDGHLSIVKGGRQSSFHASGQAPLDPTDTSVGPFRLEVVKPLQELRFIVEPNDTGMA